MVIAAAFFTADFNEFFQRRRYHGDTIPLYIDNNRHEMVRARDGEERTYCSAGKKALEKGSKYHAEKAEGMCEDLGDDSRAGYMDGVYYWVPEGTAARKPKSEIPGFQGSDHLPVEVTFKLGLE